MESDEQVRFRYWVVTYEAWRGYADEMGRPLYRMSGRREEQ